MKKHRLQISVGLLVTALLLLHVAGFITLPLIQRLELWAYDARLNFSLPEGQDSRIVIVDIDEKSLAEQGRWPWSRNRVAQLTEMLFDRYKATLVGFDVVFAEEDHSSGIHVLETFGRRELKGNREYAEALSRYRNALDYDAVMARTIKGRPVVLGYYFSGQEGGHTSRTAGMLPPPVFTTEQFKGLGNDFIRMTGYGANIPQLQQNAMTAGHFNPVTDFDGVARRVPLLIEYNGACYEALSLAMLRALLGNPDLVPGVPEGGQSAKKRLEWLAVTDLKIPVDDQVTALIPYRGKQGNFPYVSASDVLNEKIKPALLEGAIVLVGTTAPGLMDLRSTPVSPVYAGVEIHANMIAGMLDQNIKHAPYYAKGAEFLTLLLAGLLLSVLLPLVSPNRSVIVTGVLAAAIITGNMIAWNHNLVLPLGTALVLLPVIFVFNMTYGFLVEARAKLYITGLFGQYVPPQIVSVMSRDPKRFTMEAESREMTVLFSDVVGFTSVSEKLDPKQLSQLMNAYLSAMTKIIYEHGGTIDKYIGDAIMAFWGAPLDDPDHARHAAEAAIAMQRGMTAFRTLCAERGWPELKIGIGINSGEMRVGNMGSSYRMAYTVMGDAVNLASRLEGLTRKYGAWIIIGEQTKSRIPAAVAREIDLVKVKGKNIPVAIYEPLDEETAAGSALLAGMETYSQGIAAYRAKEWTRAEEAFSAVRGRLPDDRVCELYLERIADYRLAPPPEEWDGVYAFTTK